MNYRFTDHLKSVSFLFRAEGSDKVAMNQFQFRQLTKIVRHAYKTIPYYKNLYDKHNFHPELLRTLQDITLIPMISKNDIMDRGPEKMIDPALKKSTLIVQKTSGSTGIPLEIYRTWVEERLLNLFRWRAVFSFGLKIRDTVALVIGGNNKPIFLHRLLAAANCFKAFQLDPHNNDAENFLSDLADQNPDIIIGYPWALGTAADNMTPDLRHRIKPRLIITGAEMLTPQRRSDISREFNTRVFDTYGSHEFNLIAWECEKTGDLHTCDDNMIVEIIKDGKPALQGETGEVVGTALHSFGMPFIRYRLGDMAVKGRETCRCGQPFSTISSIEGRTTEQFVLPNGKKFHPYGVLGPVITHAFPHITQHQIVQETLYKFSLKLVLKDNKRFVDFSELSKACKKILGGDISFRVETVDRILPSKSGKTQSFISLL